MPASAMQLKGELDVRRKLFIARGGVADLARDCIVAKDVGFDVEKSVFSVLDGPSKARVASTAVKPFWSDAAIARVSRDFARVPRPAPVRAELLEFMARECDFKLEHADGSFMDHLTFCREYCAMHYKAASPTPLFIHSILGVATNIFPMEKDKIPQLAAILTPDEMAHVQAFPSINRIVQDYSLIHALLGSVGRLPHLRGISFHRLIDNEKIHLTADQLWMHLNFHLIHMMDFLPIADWPTTAAKSSMMQCFVQLHALLTEAGRLEARLDLDLSTLDPAAVRNICAGAGSGTFIGMNFRDFLAERSRAVGHSLNFELQWAQPSRM